MAEPIAPQSVIAKAIATIAHSGQTDKGGQPYIGHPARVAATVRRNGERDLLVAAAWLHDVLEDTDLSREDLHTAGIDYAVINIVELVTREPGTHIEDYYERIRVSPSALAVKLADIDDNTSPDRLALLDDATIVRLTRKYAKALLLLGVSHAPDAEGITS